MIEAPPRLVEKTPETNERWSCRQNKINRMVTPLKLGEEHFTFWVRLEFSIKLNNTSIFFKNPTSKKKVSAANFFHENYTNSIGMFTQMRAPDCLSKQACPAQILSMLKDGIASTHTGAPQSSKAPPTPSQFRASGFSKHLHFQIPPLIQESMGQC